MTNRRKFLGLRYHPTRGDDDPESLIDFSYKAFYALTRSIDWRFEATQAEWARRALPGIKVIDDLDRALWFFAMVQSAVVDVNASPLNLFDVDPNEPWFLVGFEITIGEDTVFTPNPREDDSVISFTTASLEAVEQVFFDYFSSEENAVLAHFQFE